MFVIATGNPFDGMNLFGPFESSEEAQEWADWTAVLHDEWWLVKVEKGDQK